MKQRSIGPKWWIKESIKLAFQHSWRLSLNWYYILTVCLFFMEFLFSCLLYKRFDKNAKEEAKCSESFKQWIPWKQITTRRKDMRPGQAHGYRKEYQRGTLEYPTKITPLILNIQSFLKVISRKMLHTWQCCWLFCNILLNFQWSSVIQWLQTNLFKEVSPFRSSMKEEKYQLMKFYQLNEMAGFFPIAMIWNIQTFNCQTQ